MAKKSLNIIEKMMDPNIIDYRYYIINCAIPSLITIKNRYQIDFGKPEYIPMKIRSTVIDHIVSCNTFFS